MVLCVSPNIFHTQYNFIEVTFLNGIHLSYYECTDVKNIMNSRVDSCFLKHFLSSLLSLTSLSYIPVCAIPFSYSLQFVCEWLEIIPRKTS